ncbi:hypothetical protein [Bacillus sp. FJAT-27251]|nr:hypothetical protein [Bacillus sp. FJAT-27251]
MKKQPFHYDGSFHTIDALTGETSHNPFTLSDEMRANISANPFSAATEE